MGVDMGWTRQQALGYQETRDSIGIPTREFDAARVSVGKTYVFLWGADIQNYSACIVGGTKGVFGYDTTTQIVSRLDPNVPSDIPDTQSLAQLEGAINQAHAAQGSKPTPNPSPVCEPSATGL